MIAVVESFYTASKYTKETMNEHRVEYMIRLKAAGYESYKFKKPIFYFDPRFEEQIVEDILWIYRNKYD